MRINSIPPKELYYQYVAVKDKVTPTVQQNQNVDRVELTSDAKTFSAAFKTAKDSLETRSASDLKRIEDITQQIRNNTYSVPGYKVAEKILGK
jgi:anti-sigma28 factor (negative regulator of flagellin synthesis)